MKRVITVIGTRPEAIKLIPLHLALKKAGFDAILCATFQHSELLEQVFNLFQIKPDIQLNVMKQNQDLFYLTQIILEKIKIVYEEIKPDFVIVQGDTTTAFCAALGAFYAKIPIGHVEAGLRSGDIYAPFPEEANRKFISTIATYHFAPTELNVTNLLSEKISRDAIFCTGNTVVDALLWIKEQIIIEKLLIDQTITNLVRQCKKQDQKIVLLTAHRRESFDGGLTRIFKSIASFAQTHPDIFIIYPYHPNPNVIDAIKESGLHNLHNMHLCPPIAYKELVYLLMSAHWVITDSGGIQEEATSLGKKVIVLRDVTERTEAIFAGMAKLVGSNQKLLLETLQEFYLKSIIQTIDVPNFVFGDGLASQKIVSILQEKMGKQMYTRKHKTLVTKHKQDTKVLVT